MSGGAVGSSSTSAGLGSSSSGTTSIGFGGSSSGTTSTGFGGGALRPSYSPWPAAPVVAKKQKTELAEKSTNDMATDLALTKAPVTQNKLPAFLQPANVTATYGKHTSSSKD